MELLTPEIGLVFWTTIAFIIVFFLLAKFAWKPIVNAVDERDISIQKSLDEAKNAREEMRKLTSQNEQILKEARIEREAILKEAREIKEQIVSEARGIATADANKIIASAKEAINNERNAAISQIKGEVAELSVEIARKVIKKELSTIDEQKRLVESLINQSKLN